MEDLGINVVFRGEDTQFTAAVKQVNKELKETKADLSQVNKELKLDPTNVQKLTEKTKLLKDMQKELTEKVNAYREAMSKVDKGSDQWWQMEKELRKIETSLANVTNELNNLPSAPAQALAKKLEDVGGKLESIGGKIENVGKKLSVLSAGAVALGTVGVKFNAQMEQYQTAFTTLIGDADQAAEALESIQKDASSSPFNTESLVQANQYLIAAGVTADESRETIMALGDAIAATGGGSNELSRMAQNLQQVKNTGKATAQDIKQFANAGINIYGLLADSTGKTVQELQDMDISYEVLNDALKKASKEGGKYYGAMEKQSETLNGSISTLKDSFNSLMGELTSSLVPIIKDIVQFVNDLITKLKEMSPEQKEMITRIGLVVAALGPALVFIGKITTSVGGLVKSLAPLVKTIGTISSTTMAWVAVIALVVAAIVTLYRNNEEFRNAVNNTAKAIWEKVKPALQDLWDIAKMGWEILKELTKRAIELWNTFMNSEAGNVFKQIIMDIVDALLWFIDVITSVIKGVKELFKWFGSLLGITSDVGNISISKGAVSGGGVYQSGGYMSGGFNITMNNSFNVNGNPTEQMLNDWADALTNRIDENLGRMYAL